MIFSAQVYMSNLRWGSPNSNHDILQLNSINFTFATPKNEISHRNKRHVIEILLFEAYVWQIPTISMNIYTIWNVRYVHSTTSQINRMSQKRFFAENFFSMTIPSYKGNTFPDNFYHLQIAENTVRTEMLISKNIL